MSAEFTTQFATIEQAAHARTETSSPVPHVEVRHLDSSPEPGGRVGERLATLNQLVGRRAAESPPAGTNTASEHSDPEVPATHMQALSGNEESDADTPRTETGDGKGPVKPPTDTPVASSDSPPSPEEGRRFYFNPRTVIDGEVVETQNPPEAPASRTQEPVIVDELPGHPDLGGTERNTAANDPESPGVPEVVRKLEALISFHLKGTKESGGPPPVIDGEVSNLEITGPPGADSEGVRQVEDGTTAAEAAPGTQPPERLGEIAGAVGEVAVSIDPPSQAESGVRPPESLQKTTLIVP